MAVQYLRVFDLRGNLHSVLIGLSIFLLVFWWIRKPRHTNLPPGPSGWPIFGYLLHLGISLYRTGAQPFELFTQLSHTYGKVYSMFMGSQRVVILNGYESIKEAFQNPSLNDRPVIAIIPDEKINTGVMFVSGSLWRHQRRFTLSTFRDFGIGKSRFQDHIAEEARILTDELIRQIDNPFDIKQLLTNAISNVICSVVFGKRFQYSDEDFNHLLDNLNTVMKISSSGGFKAMFPIIMKLDFQTRRKLEVCTKDTRAIIGKLLVEHQASFDPNDLNDYIDVYLCELQQGGSLETRNLDEDSLMKTVIQLFLAGTETSVNTLRWTLLYMMKYPDIQSRIQEEMDEIVGRNRLPRMSDKLPYTEATLMEVQRIATIVPLGVPHCAAEDTTLQGFTIPKGTTLFSNIWAVHHDPELWSDPEEFRPERFINEDGAVCQPEYYIPFSTGRRMCLGENLARMELFIFFTHLLHRFTFSKPKSSSPLSFKGWMGATNAPECFDTLITERV